MNKVGTDTRKSPQRLLQNNVQPALFILTLPLGNTLYILLSIYSSITLCLNQRFRNSHFFSFNVILIILASFITHHTRSRHSFHPSFPGSRPLFKPNDRTRPHTLISNIYHLKSQFDSIPL